MERSWQNDPTSSEGVDVIIRGANSEPKQARLEWLGDGLGRVITGQRLEPGAIVRIEHKHDLLLGEVTACAEVEDGWSSRVVFSHHLRMSADLRTLAARLGFAARSGSAESPSLNGAEAFYSGQKRKDQNR